jgi:hypothetical protein
VTPGALAFLEDYSAEDIVCMKTVVFTHSSHASLLPGCCDTGGGLSGRRRAAAQLVQGIHGPNNMRQQPHVPPVDSVAQGKNPVPSHPYPLGYVMRTQGSRIRGCETSL